MINETIENKGHLKLRDRVILTGLISFLIFGISIYKSALGGKNTGDFTNILVPTRSWLSGNNIYLPFKQNLDPFAVPYPFTAYLASVPFTWMPNWIASGVFFGLGCGILAWLILRSSKIWYLLLFLSWPFIYNLVLSQLAPLSVALFFSGTLLPMLLIKPQIALPFALIQRPTKPGLLLSGILLIASLALYPTWPVDWLTGMHLQNYIGISPIFILPFGPLILLALLNYRDKKAWLLILFALMPQRMVYDQLGVLMVARNRNQLAFLVLFSWLSFPAVIYFHGWENVPFGWQNWVLFGSYIPALVVVLLPTIKNIYIKARQEVSHPGIK